MGADAFAERARRELQATGEKVRKRSPDTADELTAQDAQIARLVSEGRTNPEIAAELFISHAPSNGTYARCSASSVSRRARTCAAPGGPHVPRSRAGARQLRRYAKRFALRSTNSGTKSRIGLSSNSGRASSTASRPPQRAPTPSPAEPTTGATAGLFALGTFLGRNRHAVRPDDGVRRGPVPRPRRSTSGRQASAILPVRAGSRHVPRLRTAARAHRCARPTAQLCAQALVCCNAAGVADDGLSTRGCRLMADVGG
jgi:hypothetical protein